MLNRLHRTLNAAIIVTEVSHLFCCVLPTIAAVTSLFAGAGLIPALATPLHDALHAYEIPIIVFSGVVVALGWFVYYLAKRTDCHALGHNEAVCHHTITKTRKFLIVGTLLFVLNLIVYLGFHAELDHLTHGY